jgi:histidinol dehydrogenase
MIKMLFYGDPAVEGEIKRLINRFSSDMKVEPIVLRILEDVRQRGDDAVLEYTLKFDDVRLSPERLKVTPEEIDEAEKRVESGFKEAIITAKERIEAFHRQELRNSWIFQPGKGVILGQIFRPLEIVGMYVPGGARGYPSSVLMNAIPATLAGVTRLVMVTPPTKDGSVNPYVLFAAGIFGITEIYKVGGAQAIGALAFGTETIPKVDKITGPGNIYVAVAKRLVDVEIDMVAGPSEVLILADRSANPAFIAADLLSQAEHDPLASAILITTSPTLAREVEEEIKLQTERLQRKTVIASALKEYSAIIVVKNLEDGIELANRIAPEHLEVMTENPFEILPWIRNAGAVFLGEHSPVPIGDYIAGPNHILPTGGAAKFSSPLGVDDFLKRTNFIAYTEAGLKEVGAKVERLAEIEGFEAHAGSIRIRIRGGINDE